MNRMRWWMVLVAVLALFGTACGSDDDGDTNAGQDTTETTAESGPPEFEAGSTMAELQEKGKIVVGVKYDQPGFGLRNPTTNELEGFDIEMAKLIASKIFGGTAEENESKVEFIEAVSKNREPYIQEGRVDLVIATYTINDTRKQVVDFAGPYFVAEQDIMVKADDDTITSVDDLNGKKVCTVKGSTSEKNVREKAPRADVTLFDTYSQCAEAMTDGRVVAVTTDNTILAGLVQASNGAFKLIEAPFSEEPYGIGLEKGDEDFRAFLNDTLEELFESGDWADAFEATLGAIGLDTPEPPTVDRYTAAGDSTATTGTGGGSTGTGGGTTGASTTSTSMATSTSTTTR